MSRITLILGGARSGKSRHAEALLRRARGKPTYIATAEVTDDEMRARTARHQKDRGAGWVTVETPLHLAEAVAASRGPTLIDCITVWIGNLMHHGRDVAAEVARLCAALDGAKGPIVIVSNEAGLGIVPDNPMARAFRDHQGEANQRLAAIADDVILVAAGLPLRLKTTRRRGRQGRGAGSGRGRKA
ncbi:MAG: bifunctional adenosylcobinamide kinase/adenosylcobinamide-phosphate guanylyltransferase [Alphaproteobacteria bacterium]|nr:bifunctional adenosylcobinamide kinase/adenosylcobinamide-phosphate guanylyltransferase [Alphaproteobacteria bacterium]